MSVNPLIMKAKVLLVLFLMMSALNGIPQVTITQSTSLLSEPSLTSKKISIVFEGESVSLVEQSGDFWKVSYNKKVGFVHQSCLSNFSVQGKQSVEGGSNPGQTGNSGFIGKGGNIGSKGTPVTIAMIGKNYFYNDKQVTKQEFGTVLSGDPASAPFYSKYKFYNTIGYVAQGGITVVGMAIGVITLGPMLYIAPVAGFFANLPFIFIASRNLNEAIDAFNSSHSGEYLPD